MLQHIIEPGLKHLPPSFDTPAARAMLYAIALQESDGIYRVQLIGNHRHWWESLKGPARGFWQFERNGVLGVLNHRITREPALQVLERLHYPEKVGVIHKALAHNDVLACVFARLLLYTVPTRLPGSTDVDEAWRQYIWAWRPGKPHRSRWDSRYRAAWAAVQQSH